jgi:flagellar biosynthesis/type III secretory pathway protein FliH
VAASEPSSSEADSPQWGRAPKFAAASADGDRQSEKEARREKKQKEKRAKKKKEKKEEQKRKEEEEEEEEEEERVQKAKRSDTVAGMRKTLITIEKDLADVLADFEKELNS